MKRTKPSIQTNEEKIQTLSSLVGRMQLANKMGLSYDGDRDMYEALGYPQTITFSDYAGKYARQDIASAVIDKPVQFTWKGPVLISEVKDADDTKLEEAWAKLEKQLKLKSKFIRLDKVSGIGAYGVLFLGFNDVSTPAEFISPVATGERKLLYVKPLAEGHAAIDKYDNDTKSERYGLPLIYELTSATEEGTADGNTTTSVNSQTIKVHYTRIIHVAGDLLESETFGEPVLKAIYNRLLDLEKLMGGSAEMFWRGARPGFQNIIDKDFAITPAILEELQDQFDEYEHKLRRMMTVQGAEMKALESQVSDPSNHVDVQLQMISAETGIPKRILTGSERGELSSSQDEDAWLSLVQTRREEHAEPNIVRPFVNMCIKYKILPEPSTGEYAVIWSDLFAPSEKEKADVGKIRAEALKAYAADPLAQFIMTPKAFFKYFLGLTEEQLDQIEKLQAETVALETPITPEEQAALDAENED